MSTSKVDTSPETILPMIEGLRLLGYEEPANRIAAIVAERDAALSALRKIAAYEDISAWEQQRRNGSYSLFDEPYSVEIAHAALSATGET